MQAVKGYLDNGIFTPHESITLPRKAEVTILFREAVQSLIQDDEKTFWADFDRMAVESSDENGLLNNEAFSRGDSGRDLSEFLKQGQSS